MRRTVLVSAVAALVAAAPAGAAELVEQPAGVGELPFAAPVVAGDRPDPDLTLVDGSHYLIATSGSWAPVFPILRSEDLREWEHVGAVLRRAPRWARDSFWAPEMTELPGGGFAVYYSAWPRRTAGRGRPRGGSRYCLGVATAPAPTGPWRDLGRPLRCTRAGAIDPTPVVEDGRLHLVYKIDGNSLDRPTPILLQRLSDDGRRLLGRPRALIRNRARWERRVVEAPELVRRDGWWQLLYSANLCCGPRCAYAVGAARARRLAGPWRKHPGNPILRGGRGWRCPGHVSPLDDHVAFHAYSSGELLGGRQLLIAPLTFGADGWPAIGDGRPPAPGAADPATPPSGAFADDFVADDARLAPDWEWPATRPPRVGLGDGALALRAPTRSTAPISRRALIRRPDAAVLARRLATDRFAATATLHRDRLRPGAQAGIAIARGGPFELGGQAAGLSVTGAPARPAAARLAPGAALPARARLTVWTRNGRRFRQRHRTVRLPGPLAYLRIASHGRRLRFLASPDGSTWRPIARRRNPVVETARIALTAGAIPHATAHFTSAELTER